ncbi:MAG: hypothetical protein D6695_05320 [Planctomycetota bacterium]|nr:MAG: hypothetical protein D6695_05320 [Planctomycetota bacterium]
MTLSMGSFGVDLLAVLVCAGLVPVMLRRLRVALIPGYLLAGMLIGPLTGVVTSADHIADVASLATVLLLFTIGLHFDFGSMKSAARAIVVVGMVSTVLSALALGACATAFGLDWRAGAGVGMALAMSSTAAVLKLLQQRREMHRPHARLGFGVLLIQDLAVVAVLSLIPMLGTAHEQVVQVEGPGAVARVALVAGLIVVGRFFITPLMNAASRAGGSELVLVVGAAVALGAAVATKEVGLSEELGAFVAGLMLASSPFRYQLSGQLAPLRDLFMAVFFTVVGLQVQPEAIGSAWWVVLLGAAVLMVVKTIVIGACSWAAGASPSVAVRTGLILAEAGEFSLIVLMVAFESGVVDQRTRAVAIAIVFVSLLVTPALMWVSGRIGNLGGVLPMAPWVHKSVLVDQPQGDRDDQPSGRCDVLIAGFGPVGRAGAEQLEKAGVTYTIVELNARTVRTQSRLGRSIVYGDATNAHVLESAGLGTARAVILTIPDDEAMVRAVRVVRAHRPDVFIAARSSVLSRAIEAKGLGADLVIVDEIAAAVSMSHEVVRKLGKDPRGSGDDEQAFEPDPDGT